MSSVPDLLLDVNEVPENLRHLFVEVLVTCGAPFERITERTALKRERPNDYVKRTGEEGTGNSCSNSVAGVDTKTLGWGQTCSCYSPDVEPCTVLDPFFGAGTTSIVCLDYGRRSIGIELSEKYLRENAIPRIEAALLSRPAMAHLTGRKYQPVPIVRRVSK